VAYYYVDKETQPTGEHDVHRSDCLWLLTERIFLGDCSSCAEAIKNAKEYFNSIDGCRHCSIECHKSEHKK